MPRHREQQEVAKEPSPAQIAARAAGAERLAKHKASKTFEPQEQKVGQDHERAMPSTGKARIDPPLIEPVDKPVNRGKLEELKFMEEVLVVMIHDSTNPTDHPRPEVWNNGKVCVFKRGENQRVKRKFVEILARAKKTTYSQRKVTDDNGVESYRSVPHTALLYPFSVIEDPSPRGRTWLKAILSEA